MSGLASESGLSGMRFASGPLTQNRPSWRHCSAWVLVAGSLRFETFWSGPANQVDYVGSCAAPAAQFWQPSKAKAKTAPATASQLINADYRNGGGAGGAAAAAAAAPRAPQHQSHWRRPSQLAYGPARSRPLTKCCKLLARGLAQRPLPVACDRQDLALSWQILAPNATGLCNVSGA